MNQPANTSTGTNFDAALTRDELRGVFLPITTPFDFAGELDVDPLRLNLRKWNRSGIRGYAVLGSTGERVNLNEAECFQVIEAARSEVPDGPGSPAFIVGVGQESTISTVNEIKRLASAVRVDAVLVITPHFYRAAITQPALVNHCQAVADSSPVPVILYSMPALTGIKIDPETAARLSEHENIIGIKDSSADIDGLKETVRLVRSDFAVLTGNGTVFNEGLRAGARGGILAVGCVAAELCLAIFAAAGSGELERAARLQSALSPLAAAVTARFGIGGLKAALEFRGYAGGLPRAPLPEPDAAARDEIRKCLAEADAALQEQSAQTSH